MDALLSASLRTKLIEREIWSKLRSRLERGSGPPRVAVTLALSTSQHRIMPPHPVELQKQRTYVLGLANYSSSRTRVFPLWIYFRALHNELIGYQNAAVRPDQE